MQYDVRSLNDGNDKVRLAKPITEMDYWVYEIMSFAEALPKEAQMRIFRFAVELAVSYGWLRDKLKFKHESVMLFSGEKKNRKIPYPRKARRHDS